VNLKTSETEAHEANSHRASSLVIDTLCNRFSDERTTVTCLYCDFLNQREQTTATMIGSLLKQIVTSSEEIPGSIQQAFQASRKHVGGLGLTLPEVLKLLRSALSSPERTYICIDALDEFLVQRRPEFLHSLQQIVRDSPGVQLFLTGRPHVWAELKRYFDEELFVIPIKPTKEDIRRYLALKLEEDTDPDAMDSDLKDDIMRRIPDSISEMQVITMLTA